LGFNIKSNFNEIFFLLFFIFDKVGEMGWLFFSAKNCRSEENGDQEVDTNLHELKIKYK